MGVHPATVFYMGGGIRTQTLTLIELLSAKPSFQLPHLEILQPQDSLGSWTLTCFAALAGFL